MRKALIGTGLATAAAAVAGSVASREGVQGWYTKIRKPGYVPPNAVFGTVSIGGAPAPQDTIVQVFFDGKAGPADAATRGSSSSGYGIDYAAGSAASCSNKVGAAIQVVVAGRLFDTGLKVGDEAANPVFRYDVVVP